MVKAPKRKPTESCPQSMYTIRSSFGFRLEKLSSTQTLPANDFFKKTSIEVPRDFPASTICRISSSKFHIHLQAIFCTPESHSANDFAPFDDDVGGGEFNFSFPNPFPRPIDVGDADIFGVSRMIVSPSHTPLQTSSRLIGYGDRACEDSVVESAWLFPNMSEPAGDSGVENDEICSLSSLVSSMYISPSEFSFDVPYIFAEILSTNRSTSLSNSITSLIVNIPSGLLSVFTFFALSSLFLPTPVSPVFFTRFSSDTTTRNNESSAPYTAKQRHRRSSPAAMQCSTTNFNRFVSALVFPERPESTLGKSVGCVISKEYDPSTSSTSTSPTSHAC
mmetsp:Transcript_3741/g.9791  ORF Transcript_3741/g.9791 Transcript_3741/m.9791 type:complete len:334 (+) Transcript_3741:5164-6165(+)